MLFKYQATDTAGNKSDGVVDAVALPAAMNAIQRRGLVIVSIKPLEEKKNIFNLNISFFENWIQYSYLLLDI